MVQDKKDPCWALVDFSNLREGVQVIFQVQKGLRNETPVCVIGLSVQPYGETCATPRKTSLQPKEENPTLDCQLPTLPSHEPARVCWRVNREVWLAAYESPKQKTVSQMFQASSLWP